jgi:flagellar FliL protein
MAEEKKVSVMMIVGLIVVGLLLAGGMSYFIATKVIADKGNLTSRDSGVFVKIGDPKDGLIVNVGGTGSGRYLKIGVILEMKPNKNTKETEGKPASPEEIKILDTIVYVLRSQKIEDFDPAKQDRLKELIKTEVNKALGEDRIYDVYITHFVLQ